MKSIPEDKWILKEVWVGGDSKQELLQYLKDQNIGINEYGQRIINHPNFVISAVRSNLMTVEISVSDLGFPDGATTEDVYHKAHELDLRLCPAELGPYIRLQYLDQPIDPPKGHWLNIAMQKLSNESDFPNGFYLRRRDDGFWLRGYLASRDHLWTSTDRFIFVK